MKIYDGDFQLLAIFAKSSILHISLGSIIVVIVIIIIIIIIITELTHSKTILENTVEIKLQPVALDFKNLSQYSVGYK